VLAEHSDIARQSSVDFSTQRNLSELVSRGAEVCERSAM
jgi:hypothetical protein